MYSLPLSDDCHFWKLFSELKIPPSFLLSSSLWCPFLYIEVFDAFLIFCSGQIAGSEITGSEGTHVFKTLDTSLATLLSRKAVPGLGSFILYPLCLSRPCCASEPRVSAVGWVKRDLEQLPVHSFPEPNLMRKNRASVTLTFQSLVNHRFSPRPFSTRCEPTLESLTWTLAFKITILWWTWVRISEINEGCNLLLPLFKGKKMVKGYCKGGNFVNKYGDAAALLCWDLLMFSMC